MKGKEDRGKEDYSKQKIQPKQRLRNGKEGTVSTWVSEDDQEA